MNAEQRPIEGSGSGGKRSISEGRFWAGIHVLGARANVVLFGDCPHEYHVDGPGVPPPGEALDGGGAGGLSPPST